MNKFFTILCSWALTKTVTSSPPIAPGLVYAPGHSTVKYYANPKYMFNYDVNDPHTGDNKAQWEHRDGDVVKGAYSLTEPDGSIRLVEYFADSASGFNAIVKRFGPNIHPISMTQMPINKAPLQIINYGAASPLSIGPAANFGQLAKDPVVYVPGQEFITTGQALKTSIRPIVPLGPVLPVYSTPFKIFQKPMFQPHTGYRLPVRKPVQSLEPIEPYLPLEINQPIQRSLFSSPTLWDVLYKRLPRDYIGSAFTEKPFIPIWEDSMDYNYSGLNGYH